MANLVLILTFLVCFFSLPKCFSAALDRECKFFNKRLKSEFQVDAEFGTLSPSLLPAITKSFYVQKECNPSILEMGCYLEFGLWKGRSLWHAQKIGSYFTPNGFVYIGFDSFEGLPSDSRDYALNSGWGPHFFNSPLEEVQYFLELHETDFSSLELIKGWYSQQLFHSNQDKWEYRKLSIITIDSDIYESAKEIMDFFFPKLILGSIVIFDDFLNDRTEDCNNYGERKAFLEWFKNHPGDKFITLYPFSCHGYAFMLVEREGKRLSEDILSKVRNLIETPPLPRYFSIENIIR